MFVGSFHNKVIAKDVAHYFERFGPLENITVKDSYGTKNVRSVLAFSIWADIVTH
jgi:hypothetical protein